VVASAQPFVLEPMLELDLELLVEADMLEVGLQALAPDTVAFVVLLVESLVA